MIDFEHITWNAPDGDHPARLAAQRSFATVARGNLEEWLEVYAADAVIEDPVGPSMFDPEGAGHRGHEGIRAFWELAIAPVEWFHFTVHDSHANGRTCANVASIETGFADGTVVTTELVTVHQVNDAGLIDHMRAYWEPERAIATAHRPTT